MKEIISVKLKRHWKGEGAAAVERVRYSYINARIIIIIIFLKNIIKAFL